MVQLRRVRRSDCLTIWKWANDPVVREASFCTQPISWDEHRRWFERKLSDPRCIFFIAMLGRDPIGQVRFDLEGEKLHEAIVSISVAASYRNKGYGAEIIKVACTSVFDDYKIDVVHAYLKPENEASARSFARAGFQGWSLVEVHFGSAVRVSLRKEDVK